MQYRNCEGALKTLESSAMANENAETKAYVHGWIRRALRSSVPSPLLARPRREGGHLGLVTMIYVLTREPQAHPVPRGWHLVFCHSGQVSYNYLARAKLR